MDATDGQIYRKHRDDLIRYATSLVGPDRAEDVLSTVVMKVLRSRSLADLDEARPYLFKAVLNESRRQVRRSGRALLAEPAWVVDSPDLDVLDAVLHLPVARRSVTYSPLGLSVRPQFDYLRPCGQPDTRRGRVGEGLV